MTRKALKKRVRARHLAAPGKTKPRSRELSKSTSIVLLIAVIGAIGPMTAAINGLFKTAVENQRAQNELQIRYLERIIGTKQSIDNKEDILDFLLATLDPGDPVHSWALGEREEVHRVAILKRQVDELTLDQEKARAIIAEYESDIVQLESLAEPRSEAGRAAKRKELARIENAIATLLETSKASGDRRESLSFRLGRAAQNANIRIPEASTVDTYIECFAHKTLWDRPSTTVEIVVTSAAYADIAIFVNRELRRSFGGDLDSPFRAPPRFRPPPGYEPGPTSIRGSYRIVGLTESSTLALIQFTGEIEIRGDSRAYLECNSDRVDLLPLLPRLGERAAIDISVAVRFLQHPSAALDFELLSDDQQ
ncbi:MAG: hypothetical protein AAGC60_00255 [Acidobacteriota bacterium]